MENSSQKISKLGLDLSKEFSGLTLPEFNEIAKAFAKRLKGGETVLFFGDLGSGKTTFIRSMMEHFNVDPSEVRSPTFNIVNTYQTDGNVVYHIDVYRITADELFELGFYDYQKQNSILLIEWAEKIVDEIEPPDYLISLAINEENMNTRDLQIHSGSEG
ncbi:MAG: tRNA (adenosine(37)-N6)-threonylcarbamoyltransferase complex ATPase subunit type 1 TsaE [Thermotogota bacterium]|nr:tRNA (adenosine(37)-N6)-threonylcarbamoyltransferase complex ATPase subunit type 1 TsaE [Thermotogota bacterium]